ncbi:poly-beta-1,6-N-acetyl-D-glucosamine biosynthesis protein PgaD [Castellaniella sp.]|uniref:poly-beta-1,6-N-acetyl-D-glucosamine biosynthesis protein PgaD n=1 Tax=Castellaniella sp. TaxID=1955812 RepID=UPI003C793E99
MNIIKTPRSCVFAAIDMVLTALAWLGFLYLFGDGIISILQGDTTGLEVPLVSRLLPQMHSLVIYAIVGGSLGILLFLWADYNANRFRRLDRRKAPVVLPYESLAASFGINLAQVQTLHSSQTIRIQHTDDGRIQLLDFDSLGKAQARKVVSMNR